MRAGIHTSVKCYCVAIFTELGVRNRRNLRICFMCKILWIILKGVCNPWTITIMIKSIFFPIKPTCSTLASKYVYIPRQNTVVVLVVAAVFFSSVGSFYLNMYILLFYYSSRLGFLDGESFILKLVVYPWHVHIRYPYHVGVLTFYRKCLPIYPHGTFWQNRLPGVDLMYTIIYDAKYVVLVRIS